MDVSAAFAELAPSIEALRDLASLTDFAADAPALAPEEAKEKLNAAEAAFASHAATVNVALPAIAKSLNASEAPTGPTTFGARLMMAQKQRTGGAPDALTLLMPDADPGDWPALLTLAEARRRALAHWFSTFEGFRKHAAHRARNAGS